MNPVIVISDARQRGDGARSARRRARCSTPAARRSRSRSDSARAQDRAARDSARASAVVKYGSPIGTAIGGHRRRAPTCTRTTWRARAGAAISTPRRRATAASPSRPTSGGTRERPSLGFQGYRRPDGRVGVRNHVLVVPTVICSSVVAERIAAAVAPIGTALPHLAGCGQLGPDMHITHDTLAAYCRHPNVGAVLVIALGCEQVVAQHLADAARQAGKPAQIVAIQGEGGTVRATARGDRDRARAGGRARRASSASACDRRRRSILSVKCGGSDYTSGLASNPALGRVADRLVDLGGAAVLGEIAEIMGAEHLLAARASSPETAAQLLRVINRVEAEAMALGLDIRGTQPSPGNIRGGLTTIEEKSLGATHKGGERTPLDGRRALRGADHASRADGHGHAGARRRIGDRHGRRRRAGRGLHDRARARRPAIRSRRSSRSPATRARRRSMADNIDLDVSGVLDDRETLDAAAERLFDEVLAVCVGRDDRGRAARPSRVRDSSPQSDDLRRIRSRAGPIGRRTARLRDRTPTGSDRQSDAAPLTTAPGSGARVGHFRWVICALLFFATTINYVDRQVIGILEPDAAAGDRLERDRLRPTSSSPSSSPMRSMMLAVCRRHPRLASAPSWGSAHRASAVVVARRRWRTGVSRDRRRRLRRRALRARPRRIGKFPGGDQDRRRMVSEERARARDRASSTPAPTSARWSRRSWCR